MVLLSAVCVKSVSENIGPNSPKITNRLWAPTHKVQKTGWCTQAQLMYTNPFFAVSGMDTNLGAHSLVLVWTFYPSMDIYLVYGHILGFSCMDTHPHLCSHVILSYCVWTHHRIFTYGHTPRFSTYGHTSRFSMYGHTPRFFMYGHHPDFSCMDTPPGFPHMDTL